MIRIKTRKKEFAIRVRGTDSEHAVARSLLDRHQLHYSVFVDENGVFKFTRTYILTCSLYRYIRIMRALVRAGVPVEPTFSINVY